MPIWCCVCVCVCVCVCNGRERDGALLGSGDAANSAVVTTTNSLAQSVSMATVFDRAK